MFKTTSLALLISIFISFTSCKNNDNETITTKLIPINISETVFIEPRSDKPDRIYTFALTYDKSNRITHSKYFYFETWNDIIEYGADGFVSKINDNTYSYNKETEYYIENGENDKIFYADKDGFRKSYEIKDSHGLLKEKIKITYDRNKNLIGEESYFKTIEKDVTKETTTNISISYNNFYSPIISDKTPAWVLYKIGVPYLFIHGINTNMIAEYSSTTKIVITEIVNNKELKTERKESSKEIYKVEKSLDNYPTEISCIQTSIMENEEGRISTHKVETLYSIEYKEAN